ncbi:MAG TPA: ABC transporter permease subunit [Thermoclostridium sp.]|nr:ABC transporter permease subunit [Thermoclostridium sp.]
MYTHYKNVVKHIKDYYELYILVMPAVIIILLFNYIPMYGVQIAFREFDPSKGFIGGEFAGLKYFIKFINSFQFTDLIKNTFFLSFYSILAGFPVPIILALFINQIKKAKAKKFIQTVSYMPHFISVIVLVGMLSIFLSPSSGIVGHVYRSFGLDPINFMGATKYFRSIYVLSDIWQHSGWNSIIYIAALSAIDPTLYEAAEVDGANRWQKLIMIDIPSLVPTIIILLILNSGNIMNIGFEKVYLMQNSMNLPVSEVISTYVYKIGIMSNQISYASAIGLFNTMINFVFLVFVNFISKKTSDISLW